MFEGNPISIPKAAEVSRSFRPAEDAAFALLVQGAIAKLEPWEGEEGHIKTFDLHQEIGARVVSIAESDEVWWRINSYHKAKKPQPSPYVTLSEKDGRHTTTVATLELRGTPEEPILTRVYPGEYSSPLPWMSSAKAAPGGIPRCEEYWRGHAYAWRGAKRPAESSLELPPWFKAS